MPVVETKTIKMFPPEALVAPIEEPVLPVLEDSINTDTLLDWLIMRGDLYKQAWQESELDKALIRRWMNETD